MAGKRMKQCSKCKKFLSPIDFHKNPQGRNKLRTICKKCTKISRHEHYLKNKEKILLQTALWTKNHPKKYAQSLKKYRLTKKGKISEKKTKAKRKRNLGWIQMFKNPFNESVLVDYHHITNVYVVAIPRELHRLYNGKQHREKTMEIVKQIYLKED